MKKEKLKVTRKMIVLTCLAIFVLISLIWARGQFLEIKEINESYVNIFSTKTRTEYTIMAISFI